MAKRAAKPDDLDLILNHERTDGKMEASSPRRRSYPRTLIPGAEACRLIKRALRCDSGEALSWLKHQVSRTAIEAHKGCYPLAYYKTDKSGKAKAAFFKLEHPLSTFDVDQIEELDWSIVSIDEGDLKKALAAELVDPNEPICADPPPRPSLVFSVAVEKVRAASGFGEHAARDWLFDALFVQARIPAWTRPTRRYPTWALAKGSSDLSLVYVMCAVLEQALVAEFSQAEGCSTPPSAAAAAVEELRANDLETACQGLREGEMREPPRRPAGAPFKWDWSAFELHFVGEVQRRGFPNQLNEEGWRTQADVARWVEKLPDFTKGGHAKMPADSTTKGHVRRWMDKHAHLAGGS